MLGSYAIVGAHLPIAVGAAWSAQLRGTDQVAVAFFGDGATNIGAFHEALNLAAVWKLPVRLRLREQPYMEYTPIGDGHRGAEPGGRPGAAYGMPGELIDGNDVVAVHDAVADAVAAGPAGDGPTVHRGADLPALRAQPHRPGKYRPAEEVEAWLAHDPLDVARGRLERAGRARGRRSTPSTSGRPRPSRAAVDAAEGGAAADPAEAFTDVWADGGAAWRTDWHRERDHLPRGGRRGHRPGDAPRPDAWSASARTSARPAGCSRRRPGCSRSSGPSGSGTRPISEQAIVGAAMGAAMTGMRPVAEIMFSDFLACCWDYLANEIPKVRYMTGGQVTRAAGDPHRQRRRPRLRRPALAGRRELGADRARAQDRRARRRRPTSSA